jgi:hypothetical protein
MPLTDLKSKFKSLPAVIQEMLSVSLPPASTRPLAS